MENQIDQFMINLEEAIYNHRDSGGLLVNFLKDLSNDSTSIFEKLI